MTDLEIALTKELADAKQMLAAVVVAAGGVVKVRPSHLYDLPRHVLNTEREFDTEATVFFITKRRSNAHITYEEVPNGTP